MDKVQSRIAVIGIIIEDRGMAGQVNELLHKYGAYIIGRMGIPYEKKAGEYYQRCPGCTL